MKKPASRTTFQLLKEMAAVDPDHEALVDCQNNLRLSYAALLQASNDYARSLLASGITHGDRVGILAGNRAEWIVAHCAITSIGAICVGLNTWASAHELAYQLKHSGTTLLFVEQFFKDRDFSSLVAQAEEIAGGFSTSFEAIYFDDSPSRPSSNWCEFLSRKTNIEESSLLAAQNAVKESDIACLLYTSGSTALPKGVPLRHQGLIDNMWEIGERQHLGADDRLWLAVSLFWSLASVNALYALLTHRGTIVLQHQFDASNAVTIIKTERCSVFYGTPNMTQAIEAILSDDLTLSLDDLSSLRTGVTIGTSAQLQRIVNFGVKEICNVYGLTETYGNSTVTDSRAPLALRLESVGQALPGQEIQIANTATGEPLPSGETGEITIRGNVFPGYWEDAQRTSESFADEWFKTGDLGYLDKQGNLFFRGRLKEMLKTGGINVAPAELEEVLSTHPAIESVFVTGIPDPKLDEAIAAVIILADNWAGDLGSSSANDTAAIEKSLIEHCRERLAPYKTPRHFRFVTSANLPLTSTGKLQRNRLVELF